MPNPPSFFPTIQDIQMNKVMDVQQQLHSYTGQQFQVFISHLDETYTNTTDGQIYLRADFHVSNRPIEDIAGVFAHEWGHLVDQTKVYLRHDSSPEFRKQRERYADSFAAHFLAFHNYPIEPYITLSTQYPEIAGDVHGTHAERAEFIAEAYQCAVQKLTRCKSML